VFFRKLVLRPEIEKMATVRGEIFFVCTNVKNVNMSREKMLTKKSKQRIKISNKGKNFLVAQK
jgi:hypothetical protein